MHAGGQRGNSLLGCLHPAVGLLLLQLHHTATLLLLAILRPVAVPYLYMAIADGHAARRVHHQAGVAEDGVRLLLARAVAEVLVVKRQPALMAEHDFRRVLQAEHMGESFAPPCAGT